MPSPWLTLMSGTNAQVDATFGDDASFLPQDGAGGWSTGIPIKVHPMNPGVPGDFSPGFGQGSVGALVWVNMAAITPTIQRGDRIIFDGNTYAVQELVPDTGGGAVLKLRLESKCSTQI